MPDALTVVTTPDRGGFRYSILQAGKTLIQSGVFHLEADARSCGEHIASDPLSLEDFLTR